MGRGRVRGLVHGALRGCCTRGTHTSKFHPTKKSNATRPVFLKGMDESYEVLE